MGRVGTVTPPPSGGPAPILFVHHGQDWIRGSERCLVDIIQHLDRDRFRPVLWCDAPSLADAARAAGAVDVHLAPTRALPERFPPVVGPLADTAKALVARYGIRLIHANDLTPFPALVLPARRGRIPLLAQMHLIPTAVERRWSMVHQATLVVGVSHASIDGLLADGMPSERIRVVYNGVDVDRFHGHTDAPLRAELGIPATATVATVVASLIERKGIEVVIRAVAALRHGGRDVHLVLCGDGDQEGALRSLAVELGIDAAAHFVGNRTDVAAILGGATDVLVSAARLEAFPLNLLEAGASGVPAVVSDIGPHRESVVDGETGLVVALDDTASFAAAIGRLADDPELRRTLGANARRRVEAHFTQQQWLAAMHTTYAELVARPRASLGWMGGSTWPPVYTSWIRDALGRRLRPRAEPRPPAGDAPAY